MSQALSAGLQPVSLRIKVPGSLETSQGLGTYPFLLAGITPGPGGPAGQFTVNRRQCNIHTPCLPTLGEAPVDCIGLKRGWPFTSKKRSS